MQEQLQKLAVSKQEVLHCLGIIGAGFLYSLGINLFVVPAGLYTGGIMGFAQLLRTLFLHVTGLELKIDIAGIINYAINLPILCIAWRRIDHRVVFKTLLSVTSTTVFLSLVPRTGILGGDKLAECLIGGMLCGCSRTAAAEYTFIGVVFPLSRTYLSVSTLSITGFVLAIHITVVKPPAAAALAPVSISSLYVKPGSLKCTCVSTSPGATIIPFASITCS